MIPFRLSAIVALFLASGPALATTLDCTTVSGPTFTAPAFITVNLQQGETLNIATAAAGTLAISIEFGGQGGKDDSICNPAFDGTSCSGFSHTAQLSGDYGVEAFAQPGDTFTMSCGASGGGNGAAGGAQSSQGAAATATAQGSVSAINSALNNALGGSAPIVATQNGLFFSSRGQDRGITSWAALQARNFNGDIDGTQQELTLGLDFEAGANTRLGFFLSAGRSDFDLATDVSSNALSIGPYFKAQISDRYNVTGFALFARPEYDVGGTSYTAERRAAGITVNADYLWGNADIRSFIGVTGFSEDHPAAGGLASRSISALTGSIGTRASFASGSPFRPYVSLGADFSRFDDGLGNESRHTGPRIGTGFTYDTGAGTLSMDLDGGRILEDTRDLQLRLKYNLNF